MYDSSTFGCFIMYQRLLSCHFFRQEDELLPVEQIDDPLNNRPIIAVLSQELSRSLARATNKKENYTSYIGAAYIKYVEMAGARAVPVLINQPDEYYETIFNGTNGLLIPGGAVDIRDSGMGKVCMTYR